MRKSSASDDSRARVLAAVTDLLDTRADADRITITDAVTAAGLTRPTFYAAYPDLPSAFAAAALARLDAAFAGLGVDPDVAEAARAERMRDAFTAILERLAEHADFFARVMRGPGGPIVQERIIQFIAGRLRESSPVSKALAAGRIPLETSSEAIAAGVIRMTTRWMDEQPRRTAVEVAAQVRDFVEGSVFGGLGKGKTS